MISYEEEKIKEQEDAIFDEREAMIEEAVKEYEENQSYASEQMMAEFNEMVAEFGEEELKALEEAMEVFDELEVIDPHMSEEDLEKLKRKHRASEDKAITKANMDYLKDIFKHHQMKIEGGGAAIAPSVLPSFASVTPAAIPVSIPTVDVPSINIQV